MKPVCPYCRGEIATGEQYSCPACQAPHHRACWSENHGCTVWGCSQGPGDEEKITVGSQDGVLAGDYGSGVAPPPPPGASGAGQYLIDRGGTRMGPYSPEEARHFFAEGLLVESDLVWREGMPSWLPLSDVLGGCRRIPPPPPPPQPAAPFSGRYAGFGAADRPKTYMGEAIAVTLLCCLPFGVVSIVYAAQVDSKFNAGDSQGAQKASDSAKTWYHAALITGLVVIVLWIIVAAAGNS